MAVLMFVSPTVANHYSTVVTLHVTSLPLEYFHLTLGLWSKKHFPLLQNWVHGVIIFLKLFSQLYVFLMFD